MTAQSHATTPGLGGQDHGGESHEAHYVRIWFYLVLLLLVSYFGPMLATRMGWHWLLLVTAFGVAAVKAYMVIKNFMHLYVERSLIHWMMAVGVASPMAHGQAITCNKQQRHHASRNTYTHSCSCRRPLPPCPSV